MLPNGLIVVLDMTLKQRHPTRTPKEYEQSLHYGLMILGMFREDVVLYPKIGKATPNPSGGHIYPFATGYFLYLYYSAVWLVKRGKISRGYFQFGRAAHVLIDMACPSHSHPAWHCSHDPFERFVEAHCEAISKLAVPRDAVSANMTPRQLIRSLIKAAKTKPADHSQSPWGRWLRQKGLRSSPNALELQQQVSLLMPLAAAHLDKLFDCFEQASHSSLLVTSDA